MSVRCPGCARIVPEKTGYCPRCGASLNVPLRLAWVARLFWACPECGSDTPLAAHQPLFGGSSLSCKVCGAAWRLDPEARTLAQLELKSRQAGPPRPIEDWLELLPPPFRGRAHAAPGLLLLPGERCFLRVDRTRMLAPRQSVQHAQPIGRVPLLPGVYERVGRDPLGPSPTQLSTEARGPFFVTDRRVVFLGNRKHVESPLNRLNGVEVDEGYLLLHRASRTDTFGFEDESAVRVRAMILALQAAGAEAERAQEVEAAAAVHDAQPTQAAQAVGEAVTSPAPATPATPPAKPGTGADGTASTSRVDGTDVPGSTAAGG